MAKKINFGIFIFSIGIVWLLVSMDVINWTILKSFYYLWPMIFIVIGVGMMFKKYQYVKTAGWVVFIATVVMYGYFVNDKNQVAQKGISAGKPISIEKAAETKNGEATLTLGGVKFNIGPRNDNILVKAITSTNVTHELKYKFGKETAEINFENLHSFSVKNDLIDGSFNLDLNNKVCWNLNIDAAAARGNIDLRDINVNNLELDVGAGKFDIKFGNKSRNTKVKISAGASAMSLAIPEDSGARIRMEGLFKKVDFSDLAFNEKDGFFVTPNFDTSKNKIDIDIEMGAAKLTVSKL